MHHLSTFQNARKVKKKKKSSDFRQSECFFFFSLFLFSCGFRAGITRLVVVSTEGFEYFWEAIVGEYLSIIS
jgi:hypothetical protein